MINRERIAVLVCALAVAGAMAWPAMAARAATAERYLHIKVQDSANGGSVNVNVPLSMAEKFLPTINKGSIHQGRVTISGADLDGLDLRALLDAVRTAADNEFVTLKEKDQEVRVAKSNGNLVVHVREAGKDGKKVDVTVPIKVVDALFSTAKQDQINIAAAIQALSDAGNTLLVTVHDASQDVRIWVDTHNSQE